MIVVILNAVCLIYYLVKKIKLMKKDREDLFDMKYVQAVEMSK